jgi:hypothetical protein
MLNPDWFPTLAVVIEKMLAPWLATPRDPSGRRPGYHQSPLLTKNILEPSAGSGNILDWICEHLRKTHDGHWLNYSRRLYACELDPDLRATLQGKNYKVIGTDFLEYHGDHQFDLVVMNPPFSAGAKHVLHAFATVAPGGDVVALVNSETIRNPYTETRQLLAKLIEDHGSVEELGAVFLEAERSTDVEVSLIRLQKPAMGDPLNFEFTGRRQQQGPKLTEDTFKSALAVKDVIGNMMLGYDEVKSAFVDYMKARRALQFFSSGLLDGTQDILKIAEAAVAEDGIDNPRASYNAFSDDLKQGAWRQVFDKIDIQKYLTHEVRQDFEKYGRQMGFMEFCKENVVSLVELVFENRGTIMDKAVVAVFDIFTQYHAENRVHVEGWKTNKAWKVNRKVILPGWVRWDDWSTQRDLKQYGSRMSMNSHNYSEYSDIDKVMCYLTGEDYNACYTIRQALETRFQRLGKLYPGESYDNTSESQFFNLRFFKKGTLHLEFKDARLHEEFNLRACAGKLWLPEPEMKAYKARTRSPFDPAPTPGPAPVSMAPAVQRTLPQPAAPVAPLGNCQQLELGLAA